MYNYTYKINKEVKQSQLKKLYLPFNKKIAVNTSVYHCLLSSDNNLFGGI